jgi:hypothetical protein
MTTDQAIDAAREFLISQKIDFSEPIHCDVVKNSFMVVFTAPGALDPNLVVDPPEIRVEVPIQTQQPKLVYQM